MNNPRHYCFAILFMLSGLTHALSNKSYCANPPSTHARLLCAKVSNKPQIQKIKRTHYTTAKPSTSASKEPSKPTFKEERMQKSAQSKVSEVKDTPYITYKPYTPGAFNQDPKRK